MPQETFSSELHQKWVTRSLRKQALCPGSEALTGLASVMLGTGGTSPCPSDLGDTVPEPGRRIPKEMLRQTENVFRGPSASAQIPSPGSACEDSDPLSPHLPSSLAMAACSVFPPLQVPVYRVLVTPSLRQAFLFPQNGAHASGPVDVLVEVTQLVPRDSCGFLTLPLDSSTAKDGLGAPWERPRGTRL